MSLRAAINRCRRAGVRARDCDLRCWLRCVGLLIFWSTLADILRCVNTF